MRRAMHKQFNRRQFLKVTSVAALDGAAPAPFRSRRRARKGPNDRITLASLAPALRGAGC